MFSRFVIGSILAFGLTNAWGDDSSFTPNHSEVDFSHLEAKSKYVKSEKKLQNKPIQKSNRPYWAPLSSLEKKGSVFFQPSMGLGLLYYRNVEGDLSEIPNETFATVSTPIKRGLSYNRTLLKDFEWGYRFFDWLKVALSYQNQSGMFLYTQPISFVSQPGEQIPRHIQQTAYFSLDALQLKAYLELPYAIIYKKLVMTPYGGFGIGPGWQTWYPVKNRFDTDSITLPIVFNPKIIPNVTFVLDKGFRLQPAVINPAYSLLLGFKFMFWGQARNLCQIEKQGDLKTGNFKPFRIKTIYSFVPYVGFQWNFPASRLDYPRFKKLYASEYDSFFIHQKYTVDPPFVFTQFNVGPNFLYFSGIEGNLAPFPPNATLFQAPDAPLNKKFKYNRVPLYEYLLGFKLSKTFQVALSLQNSTYNVLQTPYIDSSVTILDAPPEFRNLFTVKHQFKSFLNLYALMAKGYIYFPYAFRAGFVSMNYYCSLGFGASWQSWYASQSNNHFYSIGTVLNTADLSFHHKVIANPSMMVDMGFDMKNAHPDALFHVYAGIRFNLWGQVRNLGKASQQPYSRVGFFSPIKVKTLYSFTPYLSFQWDFPISKTGDYLEKQYSNSWAPFVVKAREFDRSQFVFLQTNIGPNFLRFSGVQGNYSFIPNPLIGNDIYSAPNKGRLSKNNSLLFEFLLGYKINYWLSSALSVQTQTGLYVSSKAVPEFSLSNEINQATQQFQSQVQLYSVMLKPYFEWPKAMIFRNWAYSPYLGVGCGASWQSWNNNQAFRFSLTPDNTTRGTPQFPYQLRSKACANVAWMIDAGFKTRNISPKFNASIVMGLKYNQWGQARNIGKITQQWPLFRTGL